MAWSKKMALQKFFYRPRFRNRGDFITVGRHHDLTVSKSLVDKHRLQEFEAVELWYDAEDRMMVLRFLPEKLPGTLPIRRGSAFTLAGKSFVAWSRARPGRYEPFEWDEGKKTLTCLAVGEAAEQMAEPPVKAECA
jgi:hypothetical protein